MMLSRFWMVHWRYIYIPPQPPHQKKKKGKSKKSKHYHRHYSLVLSNIYFGPPNVRDKDDLHVVNQKCQEFDIVCLSDCFIYYRCKLQSFMPWNYLCYAWILFLQGRQGIVRHMYRGTLFIYDENQEENSGIFCTKSDLCESISPPKDSFGKAVSGSFSVFFCVQISFGFLCVAG